MGPVEQLKPSSIFPSQLLSLPSQISAVGTQLVPVLVHLEVSNLQELLHESTPPLKTPKSLHCFPPKFIPSFIPSQSSPLSMTPLPQGLVELFTATTTSDCVQSENVPSESSVRTLNIFVPEVSQVW
jgi:hypothetical protein